ARHDLDRPREIIVVEHRLVDVFDDAVGGGVRSKLRIEAGLGDGEHDAQCLAEVGGVASGHREYEYKREGELRPKECSAPLPQSQHRCPSLADQFTVRPRAAAIIVASTL